MTKLLRRIPRLMPLALRPTAKPMQKTVRGRLDGAARAPKPTVPSTLDSTSSWLTSSIDLVTGVDVVEAGEAPLDTSGASRFGSARR